MIIAMCLLSLQSVAVFAQSTEIDLSRYPAWIADPGDNADITVKIPNNEYHTIFSVRPKNAYVVLDPVIAKGKTPLFPAGKQFIAAPGVQMVACEIVRKPGNEKFSCLLDADRDGTFEAIARLPILGNYFVESIELSAMTFSPLKSTVRFREMDEESEFRPVEFIMRHYFRDKVSHVDFCFEPFRRKGSWGFPHLVDACLTRKMKVPEGQYPASIFFRGFTVTALSFDRTSKELTLRVQQTERPYETHFVYGGE